MLILLCYQTKVKVKVKEEEKLYKYLDLARELKTWRMIIIGGFGTARKKLEKWFKKLKIKGRIKNIQTTALLTKFGQDTEKSSRDLRKLAVIKTPEKERWWKKLMRNIINNTNRF